MLVLQLQLFLVPEVRDYVIIRKLLQKWLFVEGACSGHSVAARRVRSSLES